MSSYKDLIIGPKTNDVAHCGERCPQIEIMLLRNTLRFLEKFETAQQASQSYEKVS